MRLDGVLPAGGKHKKGHVNAVLRPAQLPSQPVQAMAWMPSGVRGEKNIHPCVAHHHGLNVSGGFVQAKTAVRFPPWTIPPHRLEFLPEHVSESFTVQAQQVIDVAPCSGGSSITMDA